MSNNVPLEFSKLFMFDNFQILLTELKWMWTPLGGDAHYILEPFYFLL